MIDNKPGAATQLGAAYVAKQPADGYTLLLATVSTLCITPALYAKPLIAITDFARVAMMGRVVLILVCRPDLPVADPRALVALLQGKPGRLFLRLARRRHGASSAGRADPLARDLLGDARALSRLGQGAWST